MASPVRSMVTTSRYAGQGMIGPTDFVDDSGNLMPISFRFLNSLFNRINDKCTAAALPDPTKNLGIRGFVTDATAMTFGTIVAGGGTVAVPVYCDGVNWRIG